MFTHKKYNEGDNEELSQFSDENFSKCDDLILKVSKFNEIIEAAAQKYQPHLIIFFLRDVAQTFFTNFITIIIFLIQPKMKEKTLCYAW